MSADKNFKKIINDLRIVLGTNSSTQEVDDKDKRRLVLFIDAIDDSDEVKLIFRGDDITEMRRLYDSKGNSLQFNQTLFMIGSKGKKYQEKFNKKIKHKGKRFSIDDISNEVFKYIFKKIKIILKEKNNIIREFKKNNKDFVVFFKNNKNESDFLNEIQKLEDEQKIKLRDYYFILLHRYGLRGFGYNSFFLSATTKYKIAEKFAKGIILVGWLPEGYKFYQDIIELEKSIKNINKIFPIAPHIFHADQYEFTLKGGWLPHFLLGYIMPKHNKMVLNNNFFEDCNKDLKSVIQNGMIIGQSDFNQYIKKTGYCSSFWVYNQENAVDRSKN